MILRSIESPKALSGVENGGEDRDNDVEPESARSGVMALPAIYLPDGSVAERRGDALELRDGEGRLMVRYENGRAEIAAPAGDLVLAAPQGRVVLQAGTDVSIEAARDLTHRAERKVSLESGGTRLSVQPGAARLSSERLEVTAATAHFVTSRAEVVAKQLVTTAERIAQSAERYEVTATKIVETAQDVFRDVADLAQTSVGRARTLVRGAFSLRAKRAHIVSKEETKVDGKKVLLG